MMSKLVISDISFLNDLNSQEAKIAGAASAGGSAAADRNNALASVAAIDNGDVYTSANGGYRSYGYYSSYESGPSTYANASEPHYYYY
ncbi:MAG: hypothetical protein AAF383_24825 [Cyanobacteria bacterium P01_A01_bin.83]